MSNVKLTEKWIIWYPQEIFLKNNVQNNKKILDNFETMQKEDFLIDIKNKNLNDDENESKIDIIKKEIYAEGFRKGFSEGQLKNNELKEKLNNLLISFDNNISHFESQLYSELLKTVLKISSYVIGQKIDIDRSILINYIKKIIQENSSFFKKPRLIVHPDNKILIENTFKKFLYDYKWTLECNESIDLNGCKILTEDSCLDATINARSQELYRLIFSEEY